jgi:hypothetical protein
VSRVRPRRAALLAFAVGGVVIVIALVVSGLRTGDVRSFALRVPSATPIATVRGQRPVCEGPVISGQKVSAVGVFGSPVRAGTKLHITVRDAAGRSLATGRKAAIAAPTEDLVSLDHTIAPGTPLRVCVQATGAPFSLEGGVAAAARVRMTPGPGTNQFSLVLDHRGSFLGSLPTAFSRAAVFRPDWVGSWTFWLLMAALAATFGLGGIAVVRAAQEDEQ